VPFENAIVAKLLLRILTRSDAFLIAKIITFDIHYYLFMPNLSEKEKGNEKNLPI